MSIRREHKIESGKGHPLILQLDASGNPRAWINYEDAAYYYAKDLVAWTVGDDGYTLRGGISHVTGDRSMMALNTIIAVKGVISSQRFHNKPPAISNRLLFRRDCHICAYCGNKFHDDALEREHIIPVSRGGLDKWDNIVTSCSGCNKFKDDRTPEEAGMELLYVPYIPSKAEWLILRNRNILADQMAFLSDKLPEYSRITSPLEVSELKSKRNASTTVRHKRIRR